MAKAKKEPGTAKKSSKKNEPTGATAPAAPHIDTALAAQSAAAMLSARVDGAPSGAPATKPESSMFKKLKEGAGKPSLGGAAASVMGDANRKKSSPLHGFTKQVGHAQTGSNVTRMNVPRRTAG